MQIDDANTIPPMLSSRLLPRSRSMSVSNFESSDTTVAVASVSETGLGRRGGWYSSTTFSSTSSRPRCPWRTSSAVSNLSDIVSPSLLGSSGRLGTVARVECDGGGRGGAPALRGCMVTLPSLALAPKSRASVPPAPCGDAFRSLVAGLGSGEGRVNVGACTKSRRGGAER